MFDGVSVAVVTPFRDGAVDEEALRRLIRRLLAEGVDGLVPTGSTGEAPALDLDERMRVWRIAVEETRGKAFVVAGTGTNVTRSSIELSRRAVEAGVDGIMLSAPYYNKPGQGGLRAHFLAVADAVEAPMVVYNIPGRTGVNIQPATLADLARHERIVAVKEASGSLDQATEILATTSLTVLSGDDSLTLPLAAIGAHGVVSVAAHVVARPMQAMLHALRSGRSAEAAALHRRLYPLFRALFLETNPAPVKAALAGMGLIRNELRLPLVPVREETEHVLGAEVAQWVGPNSGREPS